MAGNIILQINKFRYIDAKGDPKGFLTYLRDKGLPEGLIPRYRGNRLHVLFHTCGTLIEHHAQLVEFLTLGTVRCGGLQASLRKDMQEEVAILEMQVLGLLGKTLTGPWMKIFYTNASTDIDPHKGISIVREVVVRIKQCCHDPHSLLLRKTDFFDQDLPETDKTLLKLRQTPSNSQLFLQMVAACLNAIVTVLERQYKRYFEMDLTEQLRKETESARLHNIDAEEIMGIFSAKKQRAKHASVPYMAACMRAKKNRTVESLDSMTEDQREQVVMWAISKARAKRNRDRKRQDDVRKELSRRAAQKIQKRQDQNRKALEKKIKSTKIEDIGTVFPQLDEAGVDVVVTIMNGKIVGRNICHVWYDEELQSKTVYSGKIEQFIQKKRQPHKYRIGYWNEQETYDNAVDYTMNKWEICVDFIEGDLVFC